MVDDVDRLLHPLLAQRVAGLATELVLDRLAAIVERPRAAAGRHVLLHVEAAPALELDADAGADGGLERIEVAGGEIEEIGGRPVVADDAQRRAIARPAGDVLVER